MVQVKALHASVASAPPLSSNQACNSAAFPAPSHSTVWLLGWVVNAGKVVSSMMKVACVVLSLPHSSVAVNVTVAEPVLPQPMVKPV